MSRTTKRTVEDVDASHVTSQPSFQRLKVNNNLHQNVKRNKNHTDENSMLTAATCSTSVTATTDPAFMVDLPNLYQRGNEKHNISTSTNSKFSNEK